MHQTDEYTPCKFCSHRAGGVALDVEYGLLAFQCVPPGVAAAAVQ